MDNATAANLPAAPQPNTSPLNTRWHLTAQQRGGSRLTFTGVCETRGLAQKAVRAVSAQFDLLAHDAQQSFAPTAEEPCPPHVSVDAVATEIDRLQEAITMLVINLRCLTGPEHADRVAKRIAGLVASSPSIARAVANADSVRDLQPKAVA